MPAFLPQKFALRLFSRLFLIVTLLVVFSCCKSDEHSDLATFNGGSITPKEYVEHYLASTQFKPDKWPDEQNLRDIVRMQALMKISRAEAIARGYRSDSTYLATLRKNESRVLFTKYMRQEFIDKVINDSLVQKFYSEYSPQHHMFYIMRPFLTESSDAFKNSQKDTIDYVYKLLKKGRSFKELAKHYSQDITSKDKGGDIGFIIPESMGDEILRTVMDTLKNNSYSKPVQGISGYYVLMKRETREVPVPPLEKVKDRIWKTLYRTHSHNIQKKIDERMARVSTHFDYIKKNAVVQEILQKLTGKRTTDALDAIDTEKLDETDFDKILVTFSGGEIKTRELFVDEKRAPETVANFKKKLKSLTEQRILALYAKELQMHESPEIKTQLDNISDELLRMLLYKKEITDKVGQQLAASKDAGKKRFEFERELRENFENLLLQKYNFAFFDGNFSAALDEARKQKEIQNTRKSTLDR